MVNIPSRLRARRRLIPLALLGMGILLAPAIFANDWPELRGDASRRGASSEKVVPPLSLLWRYSAGQQPQNQCAPTIVGDTVYYAAKASSDASSGGILIALDAKTGAKKWQYPREADGNGLAGKHQFLTAPLVYQDRVYVGASDGSLYVLDARTGSYILQLKTGRAINSSPTVVDGVLYFGSNDGNFYALDPMTGNQAWRQLYRPGDSVNAAPVVAAGFVFISTSDNTIHALKEKSGIFAWRQRFPYRILPNAPIFSDATLLVPTGPRLVAVQPTSGLTRWAKQLPGDILTAPTADGGIVYTCSREARGTGTEIYAFRTNNGREAWERPVVIPLSPAAPPTISGDVIYIPTNRNILYAISREDGKILWQYYVEPTSNRPLNPSLPAPTAASLTAPVSISNGTVYVLADDGSLSAFRSDAPDSTGPDVPYMYPPEDHAINGQPPVTIAATAMDPGSGVDPNSIELRLDDRKVTDVSFDTTRNLIYYVTRATGKIVDPPLQDGLHTVNLKVSDWRGNVTEQAWTFRVNNALPRPAAGEAPKVANPRPGISGSGGTQPRGGNRGGTNPRPGRGGNRGGGTGNPPGGAPRNP